MPGASSLVRPEGAAGALFWGFASALAATGKSSITPLLSNESQNLIAARTTSSGSVVASRFVSGPPVAAVPEPSALAVVANCAPALLVYAQRRRRQGMAAA